MFDEKCLFIRAKMTQSKSVKVVYLFWNLHILKRKENIYLEYMNISRQRAATRLMIDIKHQPGSLGIWLTFDIKHQRDRVLVDV